MNIESMLKREPFYEILQKSVKEYFSVVKNESITFTVKKTKNLNKMRLYSQLSFLASGKPCKKMRKALYSEYNVRGPFIKYFAGKALVFFVTHSFGMLAKKVFYTNIDLHILKELMISPCNRSIRFYYFKKGFVDCIVKDGYSNKYMQRQLQFRLENKKYNFIPLIDEYGDRWYREKILYGNPLIRVRNNSDFLNGQKKALAYMGQLAKDSISYQRVSEYLEILHKSIYAKLINFNDNKALIIACRELISYVKRYSSLNDLIVPTAETHGDLQGGNIWFTQEREIIIYDWETHKRRSVWYDAATLYWKLHSSPFNLDFENLTKTDERYLCNDTNKTYTNDQKNVIAWILYLENIDFYLDDVSQLPEKYASYNYWKLSEAICLDLQCKGVLK